MTRPKTKELQLKGKKFFGTKPAPAQPQEEVTPEHPQSFAFLKAQLSQNSSIASAALSRSGETGPPASPVSASSYDEDDSLPEQLRALEDGPASNYSVFEASSAAAESEQRSTYDSVEGYGYENEDGDKDDDADAQEATVEYSNGFLAPIEPSSPRQIGSLLRTDTTDRDQLNQDIAAYTERYFAQLQCLHALIDSELSAPLELEIDQTISGAQAVATATLERVDLEQDDLKAIVDAFLALLSEHMQCQNVADDLSDDDLTLTDDEDALAILLFKLQCKALTYDDPQTQRACELYTEHGFSAPLALYGSLLLGAETDILNDTTRLKNFIVLNRAISLDFTNAEILNIFEALDEYTYDDKLTALTQLSLYYHEVDFSEASLIQQALEGAPDPAPSEEQLPDTSSRLTFSFR